MIEEFGCKFVQFIPSNYHGKYPLSKHKKWIDYWKSLKWIELAAHGHYHDCRKGGPGECEMTEHDYHSACKRLDECLAEWDKVNIKPKGWRMPGWLGSQGSFDAVADKFDYMAIHEFHNNGMLIKNNIKVFQGADGIHKDDCNVNIWNDNTIMFQSHINGPTNDNNWNQENYKNFRDILIFFKENYKIKFKLLKELL
jgi:hypothetical protein